MIKFLKNWSLLTISNFVYQGLIFICFVKIARQLTPEIYGVFTIIITSTQIAQLVSSLGLQKIVIREVARDAGKLFQMARLTVLPTLLASVFSSLILIFYLVKFEQLGDILTLLLSVGLFIALTVWNYAEPLAFGRQQMKLSAYLNIVSSILLSGIIFLIPGRYFSLMSVLVVYVGIFIFRAAAYIFWEWKSRYFHPASAEDKTITVKYLLDRSFAYYGTTLLAIPTVQLPILFLAQFSGEKEVGYYGIVSKLSMPLSLIANNLFTAVYPVLAKYYIDNKEAFIKNTKRIFTLITIIGIALTLFLGVFGKEIIDIVLGKNYEPAVRIFAVQVWATLNLVLLSFIGTIFLATDMERLLVKLSTFNSVVIGVACYIGSYYGAFGLALGSLISSIIGFIFHWYFVSGKIQVKLDNYLKFLLLFYFIASSIISVVIVDSGLIFKMGVYIFSVVFILSTLWDYIKVEFEIFYNGIKNYVRLILSRT